MKCSGCWINKIKLSEKVMEPLSRDPSSLSVSVYILHLFRVDKMLLHLSCLQGDKIRRRNDWVRWIMPPVAFPSVPSSPSLGSSTPDALASRIQGVALEENSTSLSRSSSLDLNSQSHPSNGEGTSGQAASDPLVSGKNSGI